MSDFQTNGQANEARRSTSFGRQIENRSEVSSGRQWLLIGAFALLAALGWLLR
jgi:hypothetical protein